jgi:hypothetical protein
MSMLHSWVAQVEFREWERRFNERAARGEFSRDRELELSKKDRVPLRAHLVVIAERIRALLSAARAAAA